MQVVTVVHVADKWVEWLVIYGDALAIRLASDETGEFEVTWVYRGIPRYYRAPDIVAAIKAAYDDGQRIQGEELPKYVQ